MVTDSIAQMLTHIKNAQAAQKEAVEEPFSNVKYAIAKILAKKGYLKEVEKKGKGAKRWIKLVLSYHEGLPAVSDFKRISSPGQRMYVGAKKIPRVKRGFGLAVVSTSAGILDGEEARKKGLGGELLFTIW
jgi:small subunit ribosomal protein S8